MPGKSEAHLRLLVDTGLLLASERSLDVIVQAALDAGLQLSGARFGAFFYNPIDGSGETYPLYKLSGALASDFSKFPLPRPTDVFIHTFSKREIVRSDDITRDPRYGKNAPYAGMPQGHLPVRSYLAVPVQSRGGEAIGALLYGHPDAGVFAPQSEDLVATVAAQAAVAIENARLAESLTREFAQGEAARRDQRQAADRLAQVLEATTDAVFLLDRDWRFTYLNRQAKTLIAEGRELEGKGIWESFPQAVGSSFQQHYEKVMETGQPTEFTEFYPPLGFWLSVRAYRTPEGIAVFFQNVTEAREKERERQENASRLRQALDAGQLGTWDWNKATDLLDLDERAAELYGTEAHKPVSRTELRERIVVPDDLELTPVSLRERLESGGTYSSEYRVQSGAEQRWLAVRGVATYEEGSREMAGMIGTVQDITFRKTQEETLRQTEKLAATGRLAATIAHEINNPLEAVTNLIYLCKTDPSVPTPIQRLLETADGELARVSQIAQGTLGFYRDTTNAIHINLTELLSGVSDLFSRKLQSKNLKCDLDLGDDLHIFGLQGEVRQVFSNLLVNAIDASTKGTIRVRGRRRVRNGVPGVYVLITDEGSGIHPSIRSRLFAPFFTTKASVGTGLGLWVTRGIIEKAGGFITFRSRVDHPTGTIFRVFLPETNISKRLSSRAPTILQ